MSIKMKTNKALRLIYHIIFESIAKIALKLLSKVNSISRHFKVLNDDENIRLTMEFRTIVSAIQERKSKDIYIQHYMPQAVRWIVKNKRPLTNDAIKARAALMLCDDIANGSLDEFYNFKD